MNITIIQGLKCECGYCEFATDKSWNDWDHLYHKYVCMSCNSELTSKNVLNKHLGPCPICSGQWKERKRCPGCLCELQEGEVFICPRCHMPRIDLDSVTKCIESDKRIWGDNEK
mgnify:CR=1 FL=1